MAIPTRSLQAEFGRLFPHGFAGLGCPARVGPGRLGEASPLLAVFHPSLEQIYDEVAPDASQYQLAAPRRTIRTPCSPEPHSG